MKIFNTTIYKGSGGAGGTELVVPAIGSVQTAEINTKVLLIYATEVGGADIAVENNTYIDSGTIYESRLYGSTFNVLQWIRALSSIYAHNQCLLDETQQGYAVSAWGLGQDEETLIVPWDIDPTVGIHVSYSPQYSNSIGFGQGDGYTRKITGLDLFPLYGVKGAFSIGEQYGSSVYVYSAKYNAMVAVETPDEFTYWRFPILYNDNIYVLCLRYNLAYKVNSVTGAILETIAVEGSTLAGAEYGNGYAITPSGDYFLTWSNVGDVWLNRLTKGTTWTYERLENLPVLQEGFVFLVRAREDRDNIHIYIVPSVCTDTENVKYYIVDKATGAVSRGPDLLDTKGYDKIMTAAFDMEQLRASFILMNSTTKELKCVVSGLDTILPYEYAAVPFNSDNLSDSAVTGFVKSQDGTDELGNPIATVEALLDPNATPPSAYRIIGMNATVNEGEPL